ncbi:hypothetical protein QVD17_27904 [Tagetes erecta]|uniref:RRM domain-containing protein n=1 Tax=Tagetes erecta TaxID=13708 RepID=A0AAD8NS04_TARER|nr:hypothetical protein QVD17_27904 [Tagetes erecta]
MEDGKQANLEDLRQRKAEEQKKIKDSNKKEDLGWQNGLRRKKRYKEQKEFKNKVTYFVTNLPNGCTREGLWAAYEQFDNLMYASVPPKKDRWGYTFGFLSFVDVLDPLVFQKKLEGVKVDGRITWMTISKFGKPSAAHHLTPPPKALAPKVNIPKNAANLNNDGPLNQTPNRVPLSYRDATLPVEGASPIAPVLQLRFDLDRPAAHPLKETSLLGCVVNLATLDNLNLLLHTKKDWPEYVVRYIGGLYVLLSFTNMVEAKLFLDLMAKEGSSIFSSLVVWDGLAPELQRIAWLTITGIPCHLFFRETANQIGTLCGKIVHESEASLMDSNMSFDRVAVLTNSGEKIRKSTLVSFNNNSFTVWIREDDEDWVPSFMSLEGRSKKQGGYGGISFCNSNGNDQMFADSGHSIVGNSNARPSDYDSVFEDSMVARNEGLDTLDFFAANDVMSNDIPTPREPFVNQHFPPNEKTAHDINYGAIPIRDNDMEKMWDQIFGPSDQQNEIQSRLHSHVGPMVSSQSGHRLLDSDPFNLGPIIDEVMIAKKTTAQVIDNNQTGGSTFTTGSKHRPRKSSLQRFPDLTENMGLAPWLKLSRFILNRRRRPLKKRGCNRPCASYDGPVPGAPSVSSFASEGKIIAQSDLVFTNYLDCSVGGDLQEDSVLHEQQMEPPSPEVDVRVQEEVQETIRINSLVQIDLTGFERQVRELVTEEGEIEVTQ